jgi:hypothetical protein
MLHQKRLTFAFWLYKNLGFTLDSKLYFRSHADLMSSQAIKARSIICFIAYNSSSLDNLVALCVILNRPKAQYASVACIKLTSTESNRT